MATSSFQAQMFCQVYKKQRTKDIVFSVWLLDASESRYVFFFYILTSGSNADKQYY